MPTKIYYGRPVVHSVTDIRLILIELDNVEVIKLGTNFTFFRLIIIESLCTVKKWIQNVYNILQSV